jgi:predicted pyridoxine 5'-phosphate oxidase superfamily flavin-nucleotide-binding protein
MPRTIPEKIKKFLAGKIGWVGTASSDGMPNIAMKGSLQVLDDSHLLFADLFSLKTRKNLEENPKVAVLVADPDTHASYMFKGTAELLTAGSLYDRIAEQIHRSPKKLPDPTYIVRITVDAIYDQSLGPNSGQEIG